MKDVVKNRCHSFRDYIESKYLELRDEIYEEQSNLIVGIIDDDGNEFEMLLDIDSGDDDDEIEDIDTEDDDEIIMEFTQAEIEDLIEEINEIDGMDIFEEYEELLTSEDEDETN